MKNQHPRKVETGIIRFAVIGLAQIIFIECTMDK